MQAFTLMQPKDVSAAIAAAGHPRTKYIAGGTDLLQLAKDNVETPERMVDLEAVGAHGIRTDGRGLRLEPLARMSDVAAHPDVVKNWPAVAGAARVSFAADPQYGHDGRQPTATHALRLFPRHRFRLQQT
jgi:xanthine dehydrogenase YagS FAD-binding subunit